MLLMKAGGQWKKYFISRRHLLTSGFFGGLCVSFEVICKNKFYFQTLIFLNSNCYAKLSTDIRIILDVSFSTIMQIIYISIHTCLKSICYDFLNDESDFYMGWFMFTEDNSDDLQYL